MRLIACGEIPLLDAPPLPLHGFPAVQGLGFTAQGLTSAEEQGFKLDRFAAHGFAG